MTKNKTNEISTIYGTEKMTVTCIERRYKVENSKISFIVNARKELDEDTTGKFLHEDMELKTFLANYEITDIISQREEIENTETVRENVSSKGSLKTALKHKERTDETPTIRNIMRKDAIKNLPRDTTKGIIRASTKNVENDEIKNVQNDEIKNVQKDEMKNVQKDEMKTVSNLQIKRYGAIKRRQLFDTLDLPEEFRAGDYAKAINEKGIEITNDAMPYDDLNWLEEQGKIVKLDKRERGKRFYKLAKNNNPENSTEGFENTSSQ